MNKNHKFQKPYVFLAGLTLWLIHVLTWVFIWTHYYSRNIRYPFDTGGNWAVFLLYGALLLFFYLIYGGYKLGSYNTSNLSISGMLSVFFTNAITYIQTCLVAHHLLNPKPFVYLSIIDIIVVVLWSTLSLKIYYKIFPPYNILFIYSTDDVARTLIHKMIDKSKRYQISESVSSEKFDMNYICSRIQSYDTVLLCDLPSKQRNNLLKYCFDNSVRVFVTPKLSDILVRSAEEVNIFDSPLLLNNNIGLSFSEKFLKRSMDVLVSLVVLILTSPIMLITALIIKLYDGGPVFFKQKRCTLNNDEFFVIKFRSMIVDAEINGKPQPAVNNDPRITPFGNFIRSTRIDELPQLFNVLKGEMSLVGPRPERIEHVEQYTKEIPEFKFRSKMKAGLTGYAQLMGKYNTSPYDKLKMDLIYIANYSLLADIKYLLLTVKVIFIRDSTEGFDK